LKDWYLNTPIPNICSGFESDEIKEYASSNFSDVMYTNYSDSIIKCNHDGTDEKTIRVIIQGVVDDNVTSTTKRQLLCAIGTFAYGDYVYFDNSYWIVVANPSNNKAYEKAIVEYCSHTIKFQHPTMGTILAYPCIVSTSSTAGISDGKIITVGDAIYTIKLPFDSNTLLINIDKRFIIDDPNVEIPQVYAVSKPNRTEFKYGDKGLIELTMKQSQYNDKTDRKDLGICNYIEPTENSNPPNDNTYAVIASDNKDNKVVVGYKDGTTLSPKFFNADNIENSSIIPVWEFTLPIGLEGYIHITYSGNNVVIYTDDKFELYDTTITVSVSDENGAYKGNITLTLGGWY
jgi:hypothetical protein